MDCLLPPSFNPLLREVVLWMENSCGRLSSAEVLVKGWKVVLCYSPWDSCLSPSSFSPLPRRSPVLVLVRWTPWNWSWPCPRWTPCDSLSKALELVLVSQIDGPLSCVHRWMVLVLCPQMDGPCPVSTARWISSDPICLLGILGDWRLLL